MPKNEQGNVVKEISVENTKVKICDDFCRDRTPEQIEKILSKIAGNAFVELSATIPDPDF
jgi:hypothetical protein